MSLELERASGRDSDPRRPHAPGRRQAGCAGAARHPALPHGRQRPVCGGLPDRSAAHAVSRLARARTRPRRGSKRPCPIWSTSRTPARSGACGSSSATSTAGRSRSTNRNWKKLDALIRERADDRAWPREVLDRAGIERTGTELARRGDGEDDDRLQYALEWGFFTRCQWGEFDTALYELERCWGKSPESPAPIGAGRRPATERTIKSLDDVHAAIAHYVESIPYGRILSTATHLSTDIDYRTVSDDEMAAALARRDQAGPAERDCYASYVNEVFLTALEAHAERDRLPVQLRGRAAAVRDGQPAVAADDRPGRRDDRPAPQAAVPVLPGQPACQPVDVHAGARVAEPQPGRILVAQLLPETIAQVMRERLEMVPANKQVGFFSDAYCAEWSYAKAVIVRKILARVLAERIELGQLDHDEALEFARAILV